MHRVVAAFVPLLAPLVALTAGCGDKDPGGADGSSGPVDADGDGVLAGDDCDDEDPDRYPGNSEIWYDGVDQDCDGNDNDQDGDGVAQGSDCDDTDPTISPAEEEVWYDGIDSDCDNANDYDQDRDGFTALGEIEGGTDCDDTNPDIFPGGLDEWYDGIDSDCDGASDFDQDGDGYDSDAFGGDDCDDEDEDIRPDATEIWYDGVDQDCAGDDDNDQDGDGFTATDEGGTDCDDLDPDAFPGAGEQIDGHDTNCDGAPDQWSVDSDYGGTYIQGLEQDGMAGWSVAAGDIDGDAHADVALLQRADASVTPNGDGLAYVFAGSGITTAPTATSAANWVIATTDTSGPLDHVAFLADLNADGTDEVALLSTSAWIEAEGADSGSADSGSADSGSSDSGSSDSGSSDSGSSDTGSSASSSLTVGAVWLFSAADGATATSLDDATWTLTGSTDGMAFGTAAVSVGDLDGDGVHDLAVGAPGGDGAVSVFLSSTLGSGGSFSAADADRSYQGVAGTGEQAGAALAAVGDLNADGLPELAVGAPNGCGSDDSVGDGGHVYLVAGSASDNSGAIDDAAWGTLLGGHSGIQAGAGLAAGDLDGDGVTDLAVGARCQDTQAGRVHYVSGASLSAVSIDLDAAGFTSYTGSPVFAWAGTPMAAGDIDGNGSDDLLIAGLGESAGGENAGAVWLSMEGATSSSLTNAAAVFTGGSALDRAGSGVAFGDVNADGLQDVLFGVPGEDIFDDEGAVYIGFSGF